MAPPYHTIRSHSRWYLHFKKLDIPRALMCMSRDTHPSVRNSPSVMSVRLAFQSHYSFPGLPRFRRIKSISSLCFHHHLLHFHFRNLISPPIYKLYFECCIKCLSTKFRNWLVGGTKILKFFLLCCWKLCISQRGNLDSRKTGFAEGMLLKASHFPG